MRFEWDKDKDLSNQTKHGLSFTEASALFDGSVDYLEIFDQAHSDDEDRFLCIGPIARGVVLVVIVERDEDLTRIVSARFATKREVSMYEAYATRMSHE